MKRIIGMGNALVDILTLLEDDSTLIEFDLPKGSMQLVDKELSDRILGATENLSKRQSSGGSAANTIHGLARLGMETAFIGKVGKDALGTFFRDDLIRSNIQSHLISSDMDSGRAITFISKDSERTFATYLGAAMFLDENDIIDSLFDDFGYFHIEGYLVQNHSLIEKALKLAKIKGLKVSLDLASYNIVEANRDFLNRIINDYVDIVFANEEEAKSFTGKDAADALNEIAVLCEIAIVKLGEKGSLIKHGTQRYEVGVFPVEAVDTTGAGDLYASGFLYGMMNGFPLLKCAEAGALLASQVITDIGAKIRDVNWESINDVIRKMNM